jgi:uncharacterized membrane protein
MENSQEQAVVVPTLTNHTNGKKLLERMRFPQFRHDLHGPVVDVNKVEDERLTMGAKIADSVAATVGSWPFIIIQSGILAAWIVLNVVLPRTWDPYPFILLNLALSFQAAYAAPFVMMSQNRQAVKDRLTAENDYKTDVKGEEEIKNVMEHLDHQDMLILQIVQHVEKQNNRIDEQEKLILQLLQEIKEQHSLLQNQRGEILSALQAHPEGWAAYLDKSLGQEGDDAEGK